MLEKTFQPRDVEAKHYQNWEAQGAFSARPEGNAQPYAIVIPPPNVTGNLHMGHALNNTLQDILIRFARMQGKDALWQPGTDHAGIATQMVVERQLEAEGITRQKLGREKFLDRVWQWKDQSGGAITRQLRRLGASCDWTRERFTMDEGLSQAVRKVFVDLHRDGLIYKDKRLVNWDPKLRTAISDLEVQPRETKGNLWYFRYPLEDNPEQYIVVATTRPETMLGDSGVAVHPDDARYQSLIGKYVILPLVGRRIPIVADSYADPEQGSGAVKMTPAHDFNDFEVGRRHNLEMIQIMDEDARLTASVPEPYQGLDRFEARKKIVADMEAAGLLEKIEPHTHKVPYGERGGVPVEPFLTEQWYCDAKTLAAPAIKAVEEGRTVFVPSSWTKTYYEWMRNIQPWCISRQLWWGHRIPAWYGPDERIFVAMSEEEAKAAAKAHYGIDTPLTQDPDVLDTWFSSGLWPFSTLGWPEKTKELERYYPTDVLVTGFDIIFFWVARMMMMGLRFMGEVPFRTVYIHALVRDERGQKMSKSKGNVVDPLGLVDDYGADALRFTLAAMAAQGRDIKLSMSRVEGYRNFATKLWNATRFCEINECRFDPKFRPEQCKETLSKWLISSIAATAKDIETALTEFRFNEAAGRIYQFAWHSYCDWFLEFAKPVFMGTDEAAKNEVRAVSAWGLDQIMRMLHPFMPFITEEIWQHLTGQKDWLVQVGWPKVPVSLNDAKATEEIEWLIKLITEVRAVRAEMNVPAAAQIPLIIQGASSETTSRVERHKPLILRLARLSQLECKDKFSSTGAAQIILGEATLLLPLADVIDFSKERERLIKESKKLQTEIDKIATKLGNQDFIARAPEEVVDEQRERQEELTATYARLQSALRHLE